MTVYIDLASTDIAELQALLSSGQITSAALVRRYLARIDAYDHAGPELNAMICINPNVLAEARKMDAARAADQVRGPLHGIPLVIKDNYDTDDMPTTASSLALKGHRPAADAFQVKMLRDAGAVLMGKTNLQEFAYGIVTISSLGGQTRNPYDPERNPGGSSGGTAAAVAAGFAAAGMGSDTCGSIRFPASHNSLTGIRTTRGLSSRSGIVPLCLTQDVGGPIGKSVRDLALMLDATVGFDPRDAVTALGVGHAPHSYAQSLDSNGLVGARLGILKNLFGDEPEDEVVNTIVRRAADEMAHQGAELLEIEIEGLDEQLSEAQLVIHEFAEDLAEYLVAHPGAAVKSLAEIVEGKLHHPVLEERFARALKSEGRSSSDYLERVTNRERVKLTVLNAMAARNVDALLHPSIRRPAALIGEDQNGAGNCRLSAATGLPAISVPAGFTEDGLPVGVELFGREFDEAGLLRLAFAYEQATHHRRAPRSTPTLSLEMDIS